MHNINLKNDNVTSDTSQQHWEVGQQRLHLSWASILWVLLMLGWGSRLWFLTMVWLLLDEWIQGCLHFLGCIFSQETILGGRKSWPEHLFLPCYCQPQSWSFPIIWSIIFHNPCDAFAEEFSSEESAWYCLCNKVVRIFRLTLDVLLSTPAVLQQSNIHHRTPITPPHLHHWHPSLPLHWPAQQCYRWVLEVPCQIIVSHCMFLTITSSRLHSCSFGLLYPRLLWYYIWQSWCGIFSKIPSERMFFLATISSISCGEGKKLWN